MIKVKLELSMAKRNNSGENETTKKQKVEDYGDFWDDDLDGDLIDDCFERATQEVSKTSNDVTILPSYSFFKETDKVAFTSTQVTQHKHINIEYKLKELQDKYAEKEGEVCILRANLQNLKTSCQLEQEKKDNEWKNKISITQQENKIIKSELQFKNLEIANLKQQILELSRCVSTEQTTQKLKSVENKTATIQNESTDLTVFNPEVQINSEKCYPLKHVDFSCLFRLHSEEKHIFRTKCNLYKGAVSYLQNQPSQDYDLLRNLAKETTSIEKKKLDLNSVYPDLAYLISLSVDEIDSAMSLQAINKVIHTTLQLLTELHSYLKQVEDHIQVQDVQELDSQYLQGNEYGKLVYNCYSGNSSDELGTKAGSLVGFLAEIFPFNTFLQTFFLQCVTPRPVYAKLFESEWKFEYLSLNLDIITAIGKTRKERISSGFLSSTIKLLSKIYNYGSFSQAKNLICEIIKEILFLRPGISVIFDITVMLKVVSRTSSFIDCICFNPTQTTSNNKATKGILCFSRESCRFHMFVILLENVLPKVDNENIVLNISSNILNIIFNIFQVNNPWLYRQQNKRCSCLCQLYKLGIGIIYRNLKMFQEHSKPAVYTDFFKKSIKILNLLISNSYELTQKYVTDFAQLKEIVYTLSQLHSEIGLNESDVSNLEKLNVVEDIPEVSSDKFFEFEL